MKKFKQILSNEKGFTLVEILVVIAIIAILFVTLLPQIDNASSRARETGIKTDFHTFQTAAESYMREAAGDNLTLKGFNSFLDPGMKITGLASLKKDPWGNQLTYAGYQSKTDGNAIIITSYGKDGVLGGDDYVFATYYYKGQVTSCTTGFDTKNVESTIVTPDKCGLKMASGNAFPLATDTAKLIK